MRPLLILTIALFYITELSAQYSPTPSYLFIKKGIKKKRTYTEGDYIMVEMRNDSIHAGMITLLYNDTIYLFGKPVPARDVKAVFIPRRKNKFPVDIKTLGLITAGSAMVAGGLMLNGQEKRDEALITGFAMGYGSILTQWGGRGLFNAVRRKKFRMGNKFRLQVLDFHMPGRKGF